MNANATTLIEHDKPKEGEEWVVAEYHCAGNGPCISFEGKHHQTMIVGGWKSLEPEVPADLPSVLREIADWVESEGLLRVERWPHYKNTEDDPKERADWIGRLNAEHGR